MTGAAVQADQLLRATVAGITTSIATLLDAMRYELVNAAPPAGSDSLDLGNFEAFVRDALDNVDLPVLGMGYLPNLTESPESAILWWYKRTAQEGVRWRTLSASTHPQAIDFYDPQSSDWWQDAACSTAATASGPYVDVSGTNAYIITFADAVRRGNDLLGVIAIDVPVAALQDVCQNILLDLPRPTSVVNRAGTVIATNSGSLLGNSVDLDELETNRSDHAIAGTEWLLI